MSAASEQATGYLLAVKTVLEAVQANVDLALRALSGDGEGEQSGAGAPCEHTRKKLVSAMGTPPRYRCPDCGAEWNEEATW